MSVVATTLRGRREIARRTQECGSQTPEEVLGQMLEPWIPLTGTKRAKPKPWVKLGIPESQVFQAVVPITQSNRNGQPQTFFLEAVQSTNVRAEDRIIDLLKLDINKQALACVAASPRPMMESLIGMMAKLGTRVGLAEPAPAALYRAGTYYRKAPHGSKLSIRFFLGPRQAIGVVASGSQTLFWHIFDLPPGEETVAILAAYSTLWMIIRHCGITPPIDLVVVHGRSELTLTQDAGVFRERTGARLIRCPEPSYDVGAAAMGVALTNAPYDVDGHDLAREITPAMTVSDVFPWGEVAPPSYLPLPLSPCYLCSLSPFAVAVSSCRRDIGRATRDDRTGALLHGPEKLEAQNPCHRGAAGAEAASYPLNSCNRRQADIASTGKLRACHAPYNVEKSVTPFLTTTRTYEELLNRCLVLSVNADREQTQAIHRLQREAQTLEGLISRSGRTIIRLHQNAQRLVKPIAVVNPYA